VLKINSDPSKRNQEAPEKKTEREKKPSVEKGEGIVEIDP